MKSIFSLVLFIGMIGFFSCGSKHPSAKQVDQFMGDLSLRLNMSKDHYRHFVNKLSQKPKMISGSMARTLLVMTTNSLKAERRLLDQYEPFNTDEETKVKSKALLQAAIDVTDTYVDGSKKEMQEVVSAIMEGESPSSPKIKEQLHRFESRLKTSYDAYNKIQAELAEAYGIILH